MPFYVPDELRDEFIRDGKFFITKIDGESIHSLQSWIVKSRRGDNSRIKFTIVINSSGGSPGLILYFSSFMKTLSPEVEITGVTFGECGSAALALLQCCHVRIAVKDTGFFIHHVNGTVTLSCHDSTSLRIKREIEQSVKLEAELVKLQTKRSGISIPKWKSLADAGETSPGQAIFTSEAKKLGLIDKVIDSYPLF